MKGNIKNAWKRLTLIAAGTALAGSLALSSYKPEIRPWEFYHFVPTDFHDLSRKEQAKRIHQVPFGEDTIHRLNLLGKSIDLFTTRTATFPYRNKTVTGRLDKNEDIHTDHGVYEFDVVHETPRYLLNGEVQ